MSTLKFAAMASCIILPLLFLSRSAVGGEAVNQLTMPEFCISFRQEPIQAFRDAMELECNGISAFNRGQYRVATRWLSELNTRIFPKQPNPGRYASLALAFARMGESERATIAMDMAYTIILIQSGFIRCDIDNGPFIAKNAFTDGLGYETLKNSENRMCGEMFYNPNATDRGGFYGAGRQQDLERPYVRAMEYERIRQAIGIGRPLPLR